MIQRLRLCKYFSIVNCKVILQIEVLINITLVSYEKQRERER